jgi:hypothetical protein
LQKLRQIEQRRKAKTGNKGAPSYATEIEPALSVIPSDDYKVWFEVGCAIQLARRGGLPNL